MSYAAAVWLAAQEELYRAASGPSESESDDIPEKNYLDRFDDNFLFQNFHFTRKCLNFITDLIKARLKSIARRGSNARMVEATVLSALFFYAHGKLPQTITDMMGLDHATAGDVVSTVSKVLSGMTEQFITFPGSHNDRMCVAQAIKNVCGIPNVVGVLGSLHLAVTPPPEQEALYKNSLDYYSLMMQVICDGDGNLLSVEGCCPGGTHEQEVWLRSSLSQQFKNGQHGQNWVIAGKGHLISRNVLTPLFPGHIRHKSAQLFNMAHFQILGCSRQAFGALKNRFRCLEHLGVVETGNLELAAQVVRACCVLHNIGKKFSVPLPRELVAEPVFPAEQRQGTANSQTYEAEVVREDMIKVCFSAAAEAMDLQAMSWVEAGGSQGALLPHVTSDRKGVIQGLL